MPNQEIDKSTKWILGIILLAIALGILLYYSTPQSNTSLEALRGQSIGIADMNSNILNKPLCIVLENPNNTELAKPVMDCSLEYYQTALRSFPKKVVNFLAFNGDKCEGNLMDNCQSLPCSKGEKIEWDKGKCLNYLKTHDCYIIYVHEGNSSASQSYERLLDVNVDNNYKEGMCSIKTN